MKITRKEFGHDYSNFHFGYYTFGELERSDRLADIYAQGFLPYSLDPSVRGSFYMCRSARVPLKEFSFKSENRRIAKRFDHTLTITELSAKDAPEEIQKLFLEYFKKRHGADVMPLKRLEGILSSPLEPHIIVYENNAVPLAAVIEVTDGSFGHFWFSAYDLALTEQSLGMWLMLDRTRTAKERGLTHYYLGTVYGPKALYKTNMEPLEYWAGSLWSPDVEALKKLARSESK